MATVGPRVSDDAFRPVFVVGCQRSGSTLLGSMLGAHPEMVCIPEAHFLESLMPLEPPDGVIDPVQLVDAIESTWRFQVWDWDLAGRRPAPSECPATYRGAVEWLVRTYDHDTKGGRSRAWVEQRPGHVRVLRDLARHFPDLKAIHLVRDGRAVAASLMPLDWGPNEVLTAAHLWEQCVGRGYAAAAFLDADRLMHLRYEDVVRDPETSVRRCAEFIGVDYDPSMLGSGGLRLPRYTGDQHRLVGSPPDPGRIDAWREKLTRREVEIFEAVCGDLLKCVGYETRTATAKPMSTLEELSQTGRDLIKRAINRRRFDRRARPYREKARQAALRRTASSGCRADTNRPGRTKRGEPG